ncbi:MAG: DegQ family serine endoprotease [Candidatus Tectimicrobiota bacterium]
MFCHTFRHRPTTHLVAMVLLGFWLLSSLEGLPLGAATFWEEGSGQGSGAQPVVPAFVELSKHLKPAVVNISSKQTESGKPSVGRGTPFSEENDPFQEFFDRFFGGRGGRKRQRPSLGSGFIIHATGYIVTNNHVVEGATEIKVTMATKEELDATLVGRDPKTDLALIKVKSAKPLPTVPFGSSDALEVGEWVLAIGNPFGLGHTVTSGIVSAKGRIIGAGPYDDFIQTDASINPGNSGGPLFNMRGEVIGINTAIVAGGQGIGFAIPINLAKEVLLQLHDKGTVTRGWLGVAIQGIGPDLVKAFNLEDTHGALVAEVVSDGPAAKAGLQRGDVIIGFNGTKVQDSTELPRLVAALAPGTKSQVEVVRSGKKMSIPVTLGTLQEEKETVAKLQPSDVEESLGLRVENITPEAARSLRLENTKGVLVSQVAPDSPAAEAGIRRGDVVREINRQPVTDLESYNEATAHIPPDTPALFLLERRGSSLYVALKPGKEG